MWPWYLNNDIGIKIMVISSLNLLLKWTKAFNFRSKYKLQEIYSKELFSFLLWFDSLIPFLRTRYVYVSANIFKRNYASYQKTN